MKKSDSIERAHLVDPSDRTFSIGRWEPSAEYADLIRRFWVPVWSVPPGESAPQHVLQYPVCLIVVSADDARFYGVTSATSETVLVGDGWAVGVMLTPAAGALVVGESVAHWTDRHAELADTFGDRGAELATSIRAAMAPDPRASERQHDATDVLQQWLTPVLPVDDEGLLVNAIVDFVETNPTVMSVGQICDRFMIGERTLQRLTRRRIGISPKWLIQRRRLHESAERLRTQQLPLAAIATELGYADQSHFARDFRSVTGMTPGQFAARFND